MSHNEYYDSENEHIKFFIEYKSNQKHGVFKYWNYDGILIQEGYYINGKKHGKFNIYDEIGAMKVSIEYENNKTTRKTFYKDNKEHVSYKYYRSESKCFVTQKYPYPTSPVYIGRDDDKNIDNFLIRSKNLFKF